MTKTIWIAFPFVNVLSGVMKRRVEASLAIQLFVTSQTRPMTRRITILPPAETKSQPLANKGQPF